MGRPASWIKKHGKLIVLYSGKEDGYRWVLQIYVNKHGIITTKPDEPVISIYDKERVKIRDVDRAWFVRICGKEYMKDKEVDHDWESYEKTGIAWCRVISPEEHRNSKSNSWNKTSFVENEDWFEELYPGERR